MDRYHFCVALLASAAIAAIAGPLEASTIECPSWAPEDPGLDCHFEGDDERVFIVDDRGGQGVGFDFIISVGPISANHSFCSHCSVAVFALDLGIDLEELKIAGFGKYEIQTLEDLVAALQDVLDTQPEELQPELGGDDLAAFAENLLKTKDKALAIKGKLEKVVNLAKKTTAFDFDTVDFEELLAEIGAKHDSAFRADFNDPNDPKKNNSGIRVYGVTELLEAMANAKVPEQVQAAVQSLLSNIPGFVNGAFELSGDDDNPLAPASYHGIKTDLTVRQRSYTMTGNDTVLLTFSVLNSTPRILPLLQIGLLNDFDIPPLTYDKETTFDAATQTVYVYDEHPYEDPPIHYAFGCMPILGVVLDPFVGPVFANYNLDKNLSLTQSASSIEAKRLKFFLWHPDVSGDHDDAIGKSEKQGAVSVMFPGPMMPGEQRTAAFCYARGEGGSKAAAIADMMAKLTACKGLYGLLTPACGNGTLELGEACDDGNSASGDGCSADCDAEICGDGVMSGAEACDDANTADNDGCSAACALEKCGDGVVQTGEECDDANASNEDACTTACQAAACGDGYVFQCDPAQGVPCDSPCESGSVCLHGTFTLTEIPDVVNGNPISGAFTHLKGIPLEIAIGFDVIGQTLGTGAIGGAGVPALQVQTGPVSVTLEGDEYLAQNVEPLFEGAKMSFLLVAQGIGKVQLSSASLFGPPDGPETGETFFSIELSGLIAGDVLDPQNKPRVASGVWKGGIILRRFGSGTPDIMSDYASGNVGGNLDVVPELEGFEECDDANASSADECTATCAWAACGDSIIQADLGEQCDAGPEGDEVCTPYCTLVNLAACGDGAVDPGEECDDGNILAEDGCGPFCATERCGDGVLQPGEMCDDGNGNDGDGCTASCVLETCGDLIAQPSEECDEAASGDSGPCLSSCVLATCGDGAVWSGVEECDDGNAQSGDGCTAECTWETCGDGKLGLGEECDDGNATPGDGCSPSCVVEVCGDAQPGPGEQCDDGNTVSGDGCSKACTLEFLEACGNGAVGPGEQCDDGNTDGNDGCTASCQLEQPEACGNGNVDPGEQCDDGNAMAGDGCAPSCATEKCGDDIQQPGEACDDGNTQSEDGCDGLCQLEPASCGNAIQELGEQCDDGNQSPGDGCDAACQVEEGASVSVVETCGNGALDRGEQCDDGNHWEGDGCDELCQLEARICGNAAQEIGESCDDGNTASGDGCDASCALEGTCGNAALESGEACDDGNTQGGDGCNAVCKEERCGNYAIEGQEECDHGDLNSDTMPDACRSNCQLPSCGDGVVDSGECEGIPPCSADCPSDDAVEPPESGGCGGCRSTSTARGSLALWLVAALLWVRTRRAAMQ